MARSGEGCTSIVHSAETTLSWRALLKRTDLDVRSVRPAHSGLQSGRIARMNVNQFDRLAVGLSQGVTRRALSAAAASVLTSLVVRRTASADACGGCFDGETCIDGGCWRTCESSRDCRSKQKDDPCVNNSCLGGICVMAIVDCQPGYECCFGECCNKRCGTNEECAVFDPCRTGACVDGVCQFTLIDPCNPCVSDTDCLSQGMNTWCCGGMCRRPCQEGLVMGKGCECQINVDGTSNGLVVRDDASG